MKHISILFLILTILTLSLSICTGNYNGLIPAFLSGLMTWATWPEKKKEEKPFRSFKTWENDDVR